MDTTAREILSLSLFDLQTRLISNELNISPQNALELINKLKLEDESLTVNNKKSKFNATIIPPANNESMESLQSSPNQSILLKSTLTPSTTTPITTMGSNETNSITPSSSSSIITTPTIKPKIVQKQKTNKQKSVDWSQIHRRRIALRFCYVGTDYAGFAFQKDEMESHDQPVSKNVPSSSPSTTPTTVEGELLRALKTSCLIPSHDLCNYTKCGRTDRGVHGLTQVVSLDIKSKWKPPSPLSTTTTTTTSPQQQQQQQSPSNYHLPNSFSCWCDIPGYIPPYTTNHDFIKLSQSMQHHSTCRRNTKLQPHQQQSSSTSMTDSVSPPIHNNDHHNTISVRSNPLFYISSSRLRLLDDEVEYNTLYQQLFNEISTQPAQLSYYETKSQPTINQYSQFEIDWFLNYRFRPWYNDLILYHQFQEKLQEFVKSTQSTYPDSYLFLSSSPRIDPLIDPFCSSHFQTANNSISTLNPHQLIETLESLYESALNYNFIESTAKQYDNSLLLSHLQYGYSPNKLSNSALATQSLNFFLSPLNYLINSHSYNQTISSTTILQQSIQSTLTTNTTELFHFPPRQDDLTNFINTNPSLDQQLEFYSSIGSSTYNHAYNQDILLPLHSDQDWIDSQEYDYVNMLNRLLPPTIRIISWAPVPPSFTARFQCDGRAYKYFFYLDQMDLCIMNRAAKKLIGRHDFRNLCTMDVVMIQSFIRVVSDICIQPVENIDVANHIISQSTIQHQSIGTYDNSFSSTSSSSLSSELQPNIFNVGNLFNTNSQQTTTSQSITKYIPCKHDSTNLSCQLCHSSTFSSPETLCEAVIVGESFLYHQVRTMMALLFMIGRGEENPDIISQLLDIKTHPQRPTYEFASDKGLLLWECSFHDLPWKTTLGGTTKGFQSIHALYRDMKLKTHIIECMWRVMLPNALHLTHQYLITLLIPFTTLYQKSIQQNLITTHQKDIPLHIGFISRFLHQYNLFNTHHNQVQHILSSTSQSTTTTTNPQIPILDNSTVSQYLDIFNIINSLFFKRYNLDVHFFAEIFSWLYNLFNPNYPIPLIKLNNNNHNQSQNINNDNIITNTTNLKFDHSEIQTFLNIIHNTNSSLTSYSASPIKTSNRILSITPFPLALISPTLPHYIHTPSSSLVSTLLRIHNLTSFQFDTASIPQSMSLCKPIYTSLVYSYFILKQIQQYNTTVTMNQTMLPLPPLHIQEQLIKLLSAQQFLYPLISNHTPLFQRPLEATLEDKLAKLHGTKKKRKERNLELDQLYGQ